MITPFTHFNLLFKFFSFKLSNLQPIKKIYYSNGIFQGEVQQKNKTFIKQGLGLFVSNQGEIYYGQFHNDQIHGEGNLFFRNGTFVRGVFEKGKIVSKCLMMDNKNNIFIISFQQGVIHGEVLFISQIKKESFKLVFQNGLFHSAYFHKIFSEETFQNSVMKIISQEFLSSLYSEILCTKKDLIKILQKNKIFQNNFIAQFQPTQTSLYFGITDQNLKFQGLGVLMDQNENIFVGNFSNSNLNNFGIVFFQDFSSGGKFKENKKIGFQYVYRYEDEQMYIYDCRKEKNVQRQKSSEKIIFQWKSQIPIQLNHFQFDVIKELLFDFKCLLPEPISQKKIKKQISFSNLTNQKKRTGKSENKNKIQNQINQLLKRKQQKRLMFRVMEKENISQDVEQVVLKSMDSIYFNLEQGWKKFHWNLEKILPLKENLKTGQLNIFIEKFSEAFEKVIKKIEQVLENKNQKKNEQKGENQNQQLYNSSYEELEKVLQKYEAEIREHI